MIKENDKEELLKISKRLKYFRFYKGIQRAHEPDGFVIEITGDKKFDGSQLEEFLGYKSSKFDFLTAGETGGEATISMCLFTKDWSPFTLDMTESIAEVEQNIVSMCKKYGLTPRIPQRQRSRFYLLDKDT